MDLVVPGVLLALVYAVLSTWSATRAFGGVDGDGGWIDSQGRPVAQAPPVVAVTGHPAPWVFLVLAVILLGAAYWARRGAAQRVHVRTFLGLALATAFVAAVILVFSALQMGLVQQAFDRGSTHPLMLGNATLVVSHLSASG